jgi:DNA-binding transcriptional ArsR family regulator
MLLSKANLYTETDQMISFYARSLTHPARLQIIRSLRQSGPQMVQQLAPFHPLSLAALSQHLELLRDTQLINFQPYYPYLKYQVDEEKYSAASQLIIHFLKESLDDHKKT